jgi:hypothetical protein
MEPAEVVGVDINNSGRIVGLFISSIGMTSLILCLDSVTATESCNLCATHSVSAKEPAIQGRVLVLLS